MTNAEVKDICDKIKAALTKEQLIALVSELHMPERGKFANCLNLDDEDCRCCPS